MQEDWSSMRNGRSSIVNEVGIGALRLTLLFGSIVAALALIITPILDRNTRSQDAVVSLADGLDMTATGSVAQPASSGERYTIRRSILQSSPAAVCIIGNDGTRSGDC